MARRTDMATQTGRDATPDAERRRRVRKLTLRLALFAVAVYIVFIIAFVNQGR